MKPVPKVLLQAIAEDPELRQLPLAVGKGPKRSPPIEAVVARARARVAKPSKTSTDEAEAKHTIGKWMDDLASWVWLRNFRIRTGVIPLRHDHVSIGSGLDVVYHGSKG